MRLNGPLDEWFAVKAPEGDTSLSAANGQIYLDQYRKVASDLNAFVHQEVTKGAIQIDGGYLTDHGSEHIRTVIGRASDLVGRGCMRADAV